MPCAVLCVCEMRVCLPTCDLSTRVYSETVGPSWNKGLSAIACLQTCEHPQEDTHTHTHTHTHTPQQATPYQHTTPTAAAPADG
mmetsp:Transcript_42629/g.106467  ORF Transcript_42629/g.106467 Transcript_42629/m.106467 type:complete len:84 (+) Transcript_42629:679-930(+)